MPALACPTCGGELRTVLDSRTSGETIRRRRRCLDCGARHSTREIGDDEYDRLRAIETIHIDLLRDLTQRLAAVQEA